MSELQFWRAWITSMFQEQSQRRDERGITAETVIWTAILAAAAITIATIIVTKFTGKANSITTG